MRLVDKGELETLLKKHYINAHGVINYRGVLNELKSAEVDAAESLVAIVECDRSFNEVACEMLRGIAAEGPLSDRQIRTLFLLTEQLGASDRDEYAKTINAVVHSAPAHLIVELLDKVMEEKTVRDWPLVVIYGIGMLMHSKVEFSVSTDFRDRFAALVEEHPRMMRRPADRQEFIQQLSTHVVS